MYEICAPDTFQVKGKWYTVFVMGTKKSVTGDVSRMGTPTFVGIVVIVGIIIVTGAIFIGKSDTGEINVAEKIQNSNQANREANGDLSGNVNTVPEALRDLPNGGLVPQGSTATENQPPTDQVQGDATSETSTTTETTNLPEGSETPQTDTQGDDTDTQNAT